MYFAPTLVILLHSTICLANVLQRTEFDPENQPPPSSTKVKSKKALKYNGYFTQEWKNTYDTEALSSQPRWRLTSKQPLHGDYQIRQYINTQWADTTTCVNEKEANDFRGEMHNYLSGIGSFDKQGPLLYPLIIKSSKSVGNENSKRDIKECRYTFQFYYPLVGAEDNLDFSVHFEPVSTYYIRPYSGNYTASYCDEKAEILRQLLTYDKIDFNHEVWFCAQYNVGKAETTPRYEVWFQEGRGSTSLI